MKSETNTNPIQGWLHVDRFYNPKSATRRLVSKSFFPQGHNQLYNTNLIHSPKPTLNVHQQNQLPNYPSPHLYMCYLHEANCSMMTPTFDFVYMELLNTWHTVCSSVDIFPAEFSPRSIVFITSLARRPLSVCTH